MCSMFVLISCCCAPSKAKIIPETNADAMILLLNYNLLSFFINLDPA